MPIDCKIKYFSSAGLLCSTTNFCRFVFKFRHLQIQCISSGGSRGRRRRAPLRVQILSFWHTNFSKRSHLGSWRPPYEVGAPLREILDPLLISIRIVCTVLCRRSLFHSPKSLLPLVFHSFTFNLSTKSLVKPQLASNQSERGISTNKPPPLNRDKFENWLGHVTEICQDVFSCSSLHIWHMFTDVHRQTYVTHHGTWQKLWQLWWQFEKRSSWQFVRMSCWPCRKVACCNNLDRDQGHMTEMPLSPFFLGTRILTAGKLPKMNLSIPAVGKMWFLMFWVTSWNSGQVRWTWPGRKNQGDLAENLSQRKLLEKISLKELVQNLGEIQDFLPETKDYLPWM